jgi:hypothetical protein
MAAQVDPRLLTAAVQMTAACKGNRNEAARRLGITRDCIRARLNIAAREGMAVHPSQRKKPRKAKGGAYRPTFEQIWMVEVPRIRDSWSKATRRERNMYGTPRWSIPVPGEAWRGAVEEACA